jgi:choline dehydrogenase-like flavoprotein
MADALIIGGGLAGGAAACALAMQGRRVLLLERETGAHHKLCGEFLSAEGAAALRHLGLPPKALGAQPIRRLRLAAGATVAEAALPFTAWGLSRRRLDAALLARAAALGAEVRQGATVRALDADGSAHLADGARIAAGATLLATGKHELRGWKRPAGAPMVGFKWHLRLDPAQAARLAGHVELHLLKRRLCRPADGGGRDGQSVRRAEARPAGRPAGHRPGGLAAGSAAGRRRFPVGAAARHRPRALWPRAPRRGGEAVWRLGDQAAVTPSFTGDGMAIALP